MIAFPGCCSRRKRGAGHELPHQRDVLGDKVARRRVCHHLPIVDKVEVKIMEEYQSRVLGFLNGEFDYIEQVPESMRDMVLDSSSSDPLMR